jgi:mono/diheme cytochrome c family protein
VLLPAADGRGTWAVGLDDSGRLWRAHPGGALEEISDRYGLAGDRISDVAAAGGRLVVFLLDGALVVADGERVARYGAPGARAVAAGGRTAALLLPDRIEVLDLASGAATLARTGYPLARVRAVALDARGVLFAATDRKVYRAAPDQILKAVHDGGVAWLAAAGTRLWFGDGVRLFLSDDGAPPRAAQAGPGARLAAAAPDGSVWIWGAAGPTHLVPDRSSPAEARWQETIAPIFARACTPCHRPDGRAAVDLSTSGAWLSAGDDILQRVAIDRTMPPVGHPLSEDDRAAIRAWVGSTRR